MATAFNSSFGFFNFENFYIVLKDVSLPGKGIPSVTVFRHFKPPLPPSTLENNPSIDEQSDKKIKRLGNLKQLSIHLTETKKIQHESLGQSLDIRSMTPNFLKSKA
jgi:hypothetical protein